MECEDRILKCEDGKTPSAAPQPHLQWPPLGAAGHLVEADQHGGAGDDPGVGVTQTRLREGVHAVGALAEHPQLVAAFVQRHLQTAMHARLFVCFIA